MREQKFLWLTIVFLHFAFASYAAEVILVHGAHFTALSFEPLQKELMTQNISSQAINLLGRNGDDFSFDYIDLEKTTSDFCYKIKSSFGKKFILAHSQAGAVVNHALGKCPETIAGIIYLSSVIPMPGEKPFDRLSESDSRNYFSVVEHDVQNYVLKIKNRDQFAEVFAQDADEVQKEIIADVAVNEPAKIGDGELSFALETFRDIPKINIYGSDDNIIGMEYHKKSGELFQIEEICLEGVGHLPMMTCPETVALHIKSFVNRFNGR